MPPILVQDFNGDGHLDLMTPGNYGTAGAFGLLGRGDGTFDPPYFVPLPGPAGGFVTGGFVTGDFDGNGSPDVATFKVTDAGNDVYVLLNPATAPSRIRS